MGRPGGQREVCVVGVRERREVDEWMKSEGDERKRERLRTR